MSSQAHVSLLSRLHSRRSISPSVRDHDNDFEDARDPNTFSTQARKLSSTDSEDAIEIEGEGDFLRFSLTPFCGNFSRFMEFFWFRIVGFVIEFMWVLFLRLWVDFLG